LCRGTPTSSLLELPSSRSPAEADTSLGPGDEAPVVELVGDGVPVGDVVGVGVPLGELDGDGVGVAVWLGVVLGVGFGGWLELDRGVQLGVADECADPLGTGVLPGREIDPADVDEFGNLLPT
jgi:hypothetical protein